MYENTKYNPHIKIDLEPGIWIFCVDSATGKTRLAKHLRDLRAYGEPVDSYTYNDYLRGDPIEKILSPKNKLIMLDRYDMYNGVAYDLINECAKNSIVLIDCKQPYLGSADADFCDIIMYKNLIEVTE